MNTLLAGTARKFVLLLFVLLPFMAVLKYRFPIYSSGDFSLSGSIKDVIASAFILFAGASLIKSRVRMDWFLWVMFFFLLWMIARSFLTLAPLGLGINGFRIEGLYPLFFFMFYLAALKFSIDIVEVHKKASAIVFFQMLLVVMVAYVESYDKSVRYLFYGEKADNLVTGFPGVAEVRLVSTLENPINLGLFLCVGLVFVYFFLKEKRKLSVFPLVVAASFPVVALTFSRSASAIFLGLSAVLLMHGWSSGGRIFKVSAIVFLFAAAFSVLYVLQMADGISKVFLKRLDQTVSVGMIEDDPRISNWLHAFKEINGLSPVFGAFGGGMGLSNPAGESGTLRIENSFVTIWVQLGFIGLSLFMAILCRVLFIKAPSQYGRLGSGRSLVLTSQLMIVVAMLAGLTVDVHRNSPFSFYLWYFVTAAALFERESRLRHNSPQLALS